MSEKEKVATAIAVEGSKTKNNKNLGKVLNEIEATFNPNATRVADKISSTYLEEHIFYRKEETDEISILFPAGSYASVAEMAYAKPFLEDTELQAEGKRRLEQLGYLTNIEEDEGSAEVVTTTSNP